MFIPPGQPVQVGMCNRLGHRSNYDGTKLTKFLLELRSDTPDFVEVFRAHESQVLRLQLSIIIIIRRRRRRKRIGKAPRLLRRGTELSRLQPLKTGTKW